VGGLVGHGVVKDLDDFRNQADHQQDFCQLIYGFFPGKQKARNHHDGTERQNNQVLSSKYGMHISPLFPMGAFKLLLPHHSGVSIAEQQRKFIKKLLIFIKFPLIFYP
jgi:hypothetical protein